MESTRKLQALLNVGIQMALDIQNVFRPTFHGPVILRSSQTNKKTSLGYLDALTLRRFCCDEKKRSYLLFNRLSWFSLKNILFGTHHECVYSLKLGYISSIVA